MIERQKHILLADKSESGWFTVEEYKKHDLAENSDDEKHIFSAERRARSTLSTLKKKRNTSFSADKRPSLARTSVPYTSTVSTQQHPPAVHVYGSSSQHGQLFRLWQTRTLAFCPSVQRWPNSSLLQLSSDYKIRTNQV